MLSKKLWAVLLVAVLVAGLLVAFGDGDEAVAKEPRATLGKIMVPAAAFIAAERGSLAEAFQHTLHEAWVHDDTGDTVRASAARLNALDLLNLVHQEGDRIFEEHGSDTVMAADLLRRAGEFERAAQVCSEALADPGINGVRQVLEFELGLCDKADAECHSLGEVFE